MPSVAKKPGYGSAFTVRHPATSPDLRDTRRRNDDVAVRASDALRVRLGTPA